MKRLLWLIFIAVIVALLFRKYCLEVIYIASSSMEPNYSVNDQFIVEKISYYFRKPEFGEVVLLKSPHDGKEIVKRVIALPGEIINIENKDVYINGEYLEENYVQYVHANTIFVGDNLNEFTIPKDQYFVMGDNRDLSRDSRDWSEDSGLQTETVAKRDILGRILWKLN